MAVSIFVMEGGSKKGNLVIEEGDKEREKEGRLKSYSQHSFMYIMSSLPSDATKAQGSDLQHEGVKGYPLDLRGGVCIEGIIV